VGGIIFNRRNIPDEEEKIREFVTERGLKIVGDIPRNDDINRFEEQGKTVIEGDPELPISKCFLDLAKRLLEEEETQSV
jgi:nitrogenase iron protein NifH